MKLLVTKLWMGRVAAEYKLWCTSCVYRQVSLPLVSSSALRYWINNMVEQ